MMAVKLSHQVHDSGVGLTLDVGGTPAGDRGPLQAPVFVVGPMCGGRASLIKLMDEHVQTTWCDATGLGTALQILGASREAALENKSFGEEPENVRASVLNLAGIRPGSGSVMTVFDLHGKAHLLGRLWPDAQVIAVHRSCEDTVASILELGYLGYEDPAIANYIERYPRNFVRALSLYWANEVEGLLKLRSTLGDNYFQVTYEDLVRDPCATMLGVAEFLDAPFAERRTQTVGSSTPWETKFGRRACLETVAAPAVGCGATLPFMRIPNMLRDRINALQRRLGLSDLGSVQSRFSSRVRTATIPAGDREVELRVPATIPITGGGTDVASFGGGDEPSAETIELLERDVSQKLHTLEGTTPSVHRASLKVSIALVDAGAVWTIDFGSKRVTRGDHLVKFVAVTNSSVLRAVRVGATDVMRALAQGKLEIVCQDVGSAIREDEVIRIANALQQVLAD